MADEMREDILNYAGMNDSLESNEIEQQSYTKADENKERERAVQALMQEKVRTDSNNNNLEKEFKSMKDLVLKFAGEREELKKQLEEIKGHVSSVKDDNYQRSLKEIMDKVKKEQDEIISDEVLSTYYNEQELINALQKNANIGKVLTPREQLAIMNFEKVAKENTELKQKLDNRGLLLHRPIGKISSSNVMPEEDSADVRGLPYDEYKALQKKRQMKALESMMG